MARHNTTMANLDLSPAPAATVLAGLMFSSPVAEVIGPYSVIIVASMLGAGVGLLNREPAGRTKANVFFLLSTAFGILLTAPASYFLASHFDALKDHWLFTPVAISIGYYSHKVDKLLPALGGVLATWLGSMVPKRGEK